MSFTMLSGRAAFEDLIREHGGLIARISRSFDANKEDREDLRQEILLALWRALPAFRGDCSIKTFVARVAQKQAISHVRSSSRRARTAPLDDEYMPGVEPEQEEQAIQRDTQRKLDRILAELSLPQREAAVLLLEGFNYSEIASILGISVNAATLRSQRARIYLLSAMQGS